MNLSCVRLNEDNRSKHHKFRITNVPRATLDDLIIAIIESYAENRNTSLFKQEQIILIF